MDFKDEFLVSYTYKPISPSTEVVLILEVKDDFKLYLVGNNFKIKKPIRGVSFIYPSTKEKVLQRGFEWKETLQEKHPWITRQVLHLNQFHYL